MALTNSFFEAVNSGNINRVRIMMKNSLLVDPTFTDFREMERVAASMVGLYDEHDGKPFIEDKSQWNDDYMDKVMVKVLSNFSHERIEHLKEVVRYLKPVPQKTTSGAKHSGSTERKSTHSRGTSSSYQEQKHRDQQNGDYLGSKFATGLGIVAGGVAGGVVASVAGVTVIGGAAAGAVIGGVAASVITNGGK